jgi:hypothetical protein
MVVQEFLGAEVGLNRPSQLCENIVGIGGEGLLIGQMRRRGERTSASTSRGAAQLAGGGLEHGVNIQGLAHAGSFADQALGFGLGLSWLKKRA